VTEDFTLISRDSSVPDDADYAIKLDNDFMQPDIQAGQTVYVSCKAPLSENDIGLFIYEGNIYCRRWKEGYNGALLLLCSNSEHSSESLYLTAEQRRRCLCLGKVLSNNNI